MDYTISMLCPSDFVMRLATFERLMDTVLRGLKWNICLCYLDGILFFFYYF